MLIIPARLGGYNISRKDIAEDKKGCVKFGPVGFGEKAVYLSSFYLPRCYYASWIGVRRVFKRVAMSKGGFSGMGAFGTMAYLVVQFSDGTEKQCNFKLESAVDNALEWVRKNHPDVRTHSADAEKRLEEAKKREEGRYLKTLMPDAERTLGDLTEAEEYLEKRPELSRYMSEAAGCKRVQENVSSGRRVLGWAIFIIADAALIAGIVLTVLKNVYGPYLILSGATFIFFSLSGNLVSVGRNSKKRIEKSWQRSVSDEAEYVKLKYTEYGTDGTEGNKDMFPVPTRYAHPVVIKRMIRVVREGRARTADEALQAVKDELREMNSSVRVSQDEYNEIVAIKPLFLVSDYQ